MPNNITPGYYWFFPYEHSIEPHPVEVRELAPGDKLVADRDKDFFLAAFYVGEGWYEPLEELLKDGELVAMNRPNKTPAESGVPQ